MDKTTRISLWSGPRNVSTALMYAFAQRADTVVVDEPLYAHYLSTTPARAYHPGAEDVLASMEQDGQKVVAQMLGTQPRPVAFFKNMTHHLVGLDLDFLKSLVNVILTRDPVEMLPSFVNQIEQPSLQDVGYAAHLEVVDYLQNEGLPIIVLDGKNLLMNPQGVLEQLCAAIGIPFDEKMLSWQAGPRPEDGVWAPHWYHNVHKSTGFVSYLPKTDPFPDHLKPLLEICQPMYAKLSAMALR